MSGEQLFRTEEQTTKSEIAAASRDTAEEIKSGDVHLAGDTQEQTVAVSERSRFEVELERLTVSETREQRYEREYEIRWTE